MNALLLAVFASAADPVPFLDAEEEDAPGFVLDTPVARMTLTAWPAPAWTPVDGERLCAATLVVREAGYAVEPFACPAALRERALAALAGWTWSATSPLPPGTALLRVSFLYPSADDPRTAVFVWPLVAGGGLVAVPPDVIELRRERVCRTAAPEGNPGATPTCAATVHLDWFGRPSLAALGSCPERLRDLLEAQIAADYGDLCPTGQHGVPALSKFGRNFLVDEGIFAPAEETGAQP